MKKILWILLALIAFSCNKNPQFLGVENVSIQKIENSRIITKMDYVIFNPNSVKTSLRESNMSIFYEDVLVGQGSLDEEIKLPSNDTVRVPVLGNISLEKISQFYLKLLKSDSAVFDLEGKSKVSFMMNSFTIDVADRIYLDTRSLIMKEIKKNLSLQENFKLRGIELKELPSFNKTKFLLNIAVHNNLPFDYQINRLNLDFSINSNSNQIGQWNMNDTIIQYSGKTKDIPVSVEINNFDLARFTGVSLLSGKTKILMTGDMNVFIDNYEFYIPIKDSLAVDFKTLTKGRN